MNFYRDWFSDIGLWGANGALLLLLLTMLPLAWQQIIDRRRAVAVALLILALWWSLRAQIGAGQMLGISYHLLGVALVTLMLGPAATLWLGSLMMLAATVLFNGFHHLPVVGIIVWCSVAPPVLVSWLLLRLCQRHLPPQLFVYIFINGFLAAAAGIMLTGLIITASLAWAGAFPAHTLWQQVLPVFLFIAWGEAFLTGLLCAIFITMAPQLMTSFSDERYLKPQNRIWQ